LRPCRWGWPAASFFVRSEWIADQCLRPVPVRSPNLQTSPTRIIHRPNREPPNKFSMSSARRSRRDSMPRRQPVLMLKPATQDEKQRHYDDEPLDDPLTRNIAIGADDRGRVPGCARPAEQRMTRTNTNASNLQDRDHLVVVVRGSSGSQDSWPECGEHCTHEKPRWRDDHCSVAWPLPPTSAKDICKTHRARTAAATDTRSNEGPLPHWHPPTDGHHPPANATRPAGLTLIVVGTHTRVSSDQPDYPRGSYLSLFGFQSP